MKMKTKWMILAGLIGLVFIWPLTACAQPAADLTGVWACDDGGTYYMRQIGNILWWEAEASAANPRWANVARGIVAGGTVTLEYTDVPKGSAVGKGVLVLDIVSGGELKAVSKPADYSGSRWWRSGGAPAAGGGALILPMDKGSWASGPWGGMDGTSQTDAGTLHVESSRNASGIVYWLPKPVDLTRIQNLKWEWKAVRLQEDPNLCAERIDGFRIQALFVNPISQGMRAVTYVWHPDPSFLGRICGESWLAPGNQTYHIRAGNLNQWFSERRNVYEDYRKAYGADPPQLLGIAVWFDTDQTQSQCEGYIRNIVLE
jgi:hypothetical protein